MIINTNIATNGDDYWGAGMGRSGFETMSMMKRSMTPMRSMQKSLRMDYVNDEMDAKSEKIDHKKAL